MRVSWASQEERRDGSVLCGQSMKDKTWCHRGGASLELWTMSTGNCFGLKRKLIRNSPGLCLLQKVRLAGIYQERTSNGNVRDSLGPGRSQVSLALNVVLLPVRRTALASPAVAGCHGAAKRIDRKRGRKKRLQRRGDTESPFVGREMFPAVGVYLIIAVLSAILQENIKK